MLAFFVRRWLREKERKKGDALLLLGIWWGVGSLLFLPLAFDLAPRFFLVLLPIPFLLIGIFLEELALLLRRFFGRRGGFLLVLFGGWTIVVVAGVMLWNRFDQLERSRHEVVKLPYGDALLKERTRVTLGQQRAIVQYLAERARREGKPLLFHADSYYKRSFKYLLLQEGVDVGSLRGKRVYRDALQVYILRTAADPKKKLGSYLERYRIKERIPFGTLTVLILEPKEEAITDEQPAFSPPQYSNVQEDTRVQKRYTWGEIVDRWFSHQEK